MVSSDSDINTLVSSLMRLVFAHQDVQNLTHDLSEINKFPSRVGLDSTIKGIETQLSGRQSDFSDDHKKAANALERLLKPLAAPRDTGGASRDQIDKLHRRIDQLQDEQKLQVRKFDSLANAHDRLKDDYSQLKADVRSLRGRLENNERRSPAAPIAGAAASTAPVAPPTGPASYLASASATPVIEGSHLSCEAKIRNTWDCTKERLQPLQTKIDKVEGRIEKYERQMDSDSRALTDKISEIKNDLEQDLAKLRTDTRLARSDATLSLKKVKALDESIARIHKELHAGDDVEDGEIEDVEDGEAAMIQD